MNEKTALISHIASRALALMARKNLIMSDTAGRAVVYAWPRDDRLILVVDPELIKNQQKILSDDFRHDLSTILAGRRVVTTNSRGIFFQVAYEAPPAPKALRLVSLDLNEQPSPLHVPIGMTRNGPLWLPVVDLDAVLIGGSRRMGKTRVLHGFVLALLNGGQAELYLYDGKGGMEFGRYAGQPAAHIAQDLKQALMDLRIEMARREPVLRAAGASSMAEYNQLYPNDRLKALVLFVDEVAHVPEDCQQLLSDLVGRGGAYGVFPILATTYPGHKEVQSLVRANLSTRISLPVPTQAESRVILGQGGAEDLPKIKGRMLMVWDARLVEIQAFDIHLPDPKALYLGPVLSGRDLEIAQVACNSDGLLSIRLLKESFGISGWKSGQLLKAWEARGWIEKSPDDANARRVTPILLDIVRQSPKSPETSETPKTSKTGLNPEQIGEAA